MEGGEGISDEIIPRTKYTGTVYPYIPNSFGSPKHGWPQQGAVSPTSVSVTIIYLLHGNYLCFYVLLFIVHPPPFPHN